MVSPDRDHRCGDVEDIFSKYSFDLYATDANQLGLMRSHENNAEGNEDTEILLDNNVDQIKTSDLAARFKLRFVTDQSHPDPLNHSPNRSRSHSLSMTINSCTAMSDSYAVHAKAQGDTHAWNATQDIVVPYEEDNMRESW